MSDQEVEEFFVDDKSINEALLYMNGLNKENSNEIDTIELSQTISLLYDLEYVNKLKSTPITIPNPILIPQERPFQLFQWRVVIRLAFGYALFTRGYIAYNLKSFLYIFGKFYLQIIQISQMTIF